MTKRRRSPDDNRTQYFYDGQQCIAVLEQKTDGWHLTVRCRVAGTYQTREQAIRALAEQEGEL